MMALGTLTLLLVPRKEEKVEIGSASDNLKVPLITRAPRIWSLSQLLPLKVCLEQPLGQSLY